MINGEKIQIHVRLRCGATRSLSVAKPLPIAQIRKTKPEVVAEIDRLLDQHCLVMEAMAESSSRST